MNEPTNAVLAEQIRQLQKEFKDNKLNTKEELKELEEKLNQTTRVTNEVNLSMQYVKEAVNDMRGMMKEFVGMITTQNGQIDKKISEQHKKIDEFINSDKRSDSKKQFIVSIAQVLAGILATVLGFWASGKI
ncbi:hypothetical protein [Bacillus sp. FJAT-22090]|uniref:hypothetical protein n=1 Tax=Bacillus sp. FJAT-22090 TaxID=1581038 RepID=UPI0011A964EA|nr:hypothetical protein [Bacillus sp. FJAT-22090]